MVNNIKSRSKKIRRLGPISNFYRKSLSPHKLTTPGMHPKLLLKDGQVSAQQSVLEDYKTQHSNTQKLRYSYGLQKNTLKKYCKISYKHKLNRDFILFKQLEFRLDALTLKLGFAKTILEARQIVSHGHIMLNGKKTTIASTICKAGDIISINYSSKVYANVELNLIEQLNTKFEDFELAQSEKKNKDLKYRYNILTPFSAFGTNAVSVVSNKTSILQIVSPMKLEKTIETPFLTEIVLHNVKH